MNFVPEYILKLSISLAGVFLFYYFILRRLTFYNYNRWYLLAYTILCFFIPFINISIVLQKNNWQQNGIVNWVPVISSDAVRELPATTAGTWGLWQWTIAIIIAGMLVMLCRLVLQLFSFKKMLQKAEPFSSDGMNLYQVNDNIIPFSFGNAIFINKHLHAEHELEEIIGHEFVHVKQRHSLDIIWSELLCIVNWYNPFVWLLKRSIRQNLEFIADHKVLENGIDKKDYQYLLLKVIGNNQYSIANQFNFSSLKKRIAMMNKTKSAKRQLIRLLFLLPATAVLLLAFRGKWSAAGNTAVIEDKKVALAGLVVDAKTLKPLADANIFCKEKNIDTRTDSKGYYLLQLPFENKPLQFTLQITKAGYQPFHQTENWGNFYQDHIYSRYSKSIEYFGLSNNNTEGFSSLGSVADISGLTYDNVAKQLPAIFNPASPAYDGTISRDTTKKNKPNSKGYIISVKNISGEDLVVIKDKAGKEIKTMPVKEWDENEEKYEKIYGEATAIPPVSPVATAMAETISPVTGSAMVEVAAPTSVNAVATISPLKIATVTISPLKVATVVSSPVKTVTIATAPVKVTTVISSSVKAATSVKPVVAISPETVVEVASTTPAVVVIPSVTSVIAQLPDNVKKIQVENNKVTLWLKNGRKEHFDLNNAEEKKELEKKYSIYAPSKPVPLVEPSAKEN
jgi:beta-lactamase regulating signal transducer with metallopeptidase domain